MVDLSQQNDKRLLT